MTDRRLLLALARILRAAADEAEACASEAEPVRQPTEIRTSGKPISELAAQRALLAIARGAPEADRLVVDALGAVLDDVVGERERVG